MNIVVSSGSFLLSFCFPFLQVFTAAAPPSMDWRPHLVRNPAHPRRPLLGSVVVDRSGFFKTRSDNLCLLQPSTRPSTGLQGFPPSSRAPPPRHPATTRRRVVSHAPARDLHSPARSGCAPLLLRRPPPLLLSFGVFLVFFYAVVFLGLLSPCIYLVCIYCGDFVIGVCFPASDLIWNAAVPSPQLPPSRWLLPSFGAPHGAPLPFKTALCGPWRGPTCYWSF